MISILTLQSSNNSNNDNIICTTFKPAIITEHQEPSIRAVSPIKNNEEDLEKTKNILLEIKKSQPYYKKQKKDCIEILDKHKITRNIFKIISASMFPYNTLSFEKSGEEQRLESFFQHEVLCTYGSQNFGIFGCVGGYQKKI